MNDQTQTLILGPEEEAGRLWQAALEARAAANAVAAEVAVGALSEALDLGLRAAEIHAVRRLRPIKEKFPATLGLLLDTPGPEVEVYRDAIHIPPTLGFTDVLDLLSEESLDCVGPGLHRGWEDRVFSCRRSRAAAQEAIGVTLGAAERERLLILAAYRNRIFRSPPPIAIEPAKITGSFAELERLVSALAS